MSVPKMVCVCAHCFQSNSDATIEWNFRDQAIYYMCPSCKKPNKMSMKPIKAQPLPRARLSR
jgi:hypothetical protein